MIRALILFILFFYCLQGFGKEHFCDSALISEIIEYKMKDDAVFMREYIIMLDSATNPDTIPFKKFNIILLSNTTYRYIIKGSPKCKCEPKLSLVTKSGQVLDSTGYQKGKKVSQFEYQIKETSAYDLIVNFKDGKKGCAVLGMFYVPATNHVPASGKSK